MNREIQLSLPTNKTTERAAMYVGKFWSSVLGIGREHKERNSTELTGFLTSSHHQERRDENIHMCYL
jgi:hypothetical protein